MRTTGSTATTPVVLVVLVYGLRNGLLLAQAAAGVPDLTVRAMEPRTKCQWPWGAKKFGQGRK